MVRVQSNRWVALAVMLVIAGVLLSFAFVGSVRAATFTVTNTNDAGAGSLRQAIIDANAAAGADVIDFDPGVFATTQTINLTSGELVVNSEIDFQGPAANVIVNQSVANQRVMRMEGGPVTMTNMTIQGGGLNANGSGILINNSDAMSRVYRFGAGVVIRNNLGTGTLASGGGIAAFNGAQVYLQDGMQVINNTARSGAGIFLNFEADLFIDGATISGNTASVQAGGIRVSGTGDSPANPGNQATATITNATITNNSAFVGGGVYAFGPVVMTITNSTINANTASFFGGLTAEGSLRAVAGFENAGSPTITVNGGTINRDTGACAGGAGAATVGASITLQNAVVANNNLTTADTCVVVVAGVPVVIPAGNGGGFIVSNNGTNNPTWDVPATLNVTGGSQVNRNTSVREGGGIYAVGGSTVVVAGSSVQNNSAVEQGGGVRLIGSTLTLGGTTGNGISSNSFSGTGLRRGGGIAASDGSTVTVNDNQRIVQNMTNIATGGGISLEGATTTMTINQARIANNVVTDDGGGIYIDAATLTFNSGRISTNTAGGSGGGIWVGNGGTADLNGGAVDNNTATDGFGGGINNDSTVTLTIDGVQVFNNSAAIAGGGIYSNFGASLVVNSSNINRNSSPMGGGGGIYSFGPVNLTDTNVNNNDAGQGGGVYIAFETATVVNGSISGNTSLGGGGGVYVDDGALTMTGTVMDDNSTSGEGGAIYVSGSLSVTGARIVNNSAAAGGAVFQAGGASGAAVTTSCIVCNSDDAVDYSGGATPLAFGGNWWGSTYGPFYSTDTQGLQCSTGDSLNSSNPLADYGISVTTPSDAACNVAPIGNWSVTPLAGCTGDEIVRPSSVGSARLCPRDADLPMIASPAP